MSIANVKVKWDSFLESILCFADDSMIIMYHPLVLKRKEAKEQYSRWEKALRDFLVFEIRHSMKNTPTAPIRIGSAGCWTCSVDYNGSTKSEKAIGERMLLLLKKYLSSLRGGIIDVEWISFANRANKKKTYIFYILF